MIGGKGSNGVKIGDTQIDDTFAEAFRMRYARVVITAVDPFWAETAGRSVSGYGTSVIGCDAEAGIELPLAEGDTPDGRPGVGVLLFGFSTEALAKAAPNRVGQCVMTCATTAVFDGIEEGEERIPLGKHLRYFGDGFQKSKQIDGRRYWRIPVMDGEFFVADSLGVAKGIAGGNIILQAIDAAAGLAAARRAAEAVAKQPGVIAPFPGGVVRSGSKVGSRYRPLVASTSDPFCPTLRGRTETKLHTEANCAYEIVIDGVDEAAVGRAMAAAIHAAAGPGVVLIGAGNYGGKLGKFHFHLHRILQ
ncbi:MAG: formylmethanofuran--tetrahydromethanopterin N-formyltransferase [Pirellulales bacterium]|nr:formylmethanofuran--tetrahydromethanopterin N-formyltransferase [Pirellulales bacterium]